MLASDLRLQRADHLVISTVELSSTRKKAEEWCITELLVAYPALIDLHANCEELNYPLRHFPRSPDRHSSPS